MTQRISDNRTLLPTSEACKITGFSSAYIQRLLREKRIEGRKIGAVWLIYEDSLHAFTAQPRKRGPKGPHKNTQAKKNLQEVEHAKHVGRISEIERKQEE